MSPLEDTQPSTWTPDSTLETLVPTPIEGRDTGVGKDARAPARATGQQRVVAAGDCVPLELPVSYEGFRGLDTSGLWERGGKKGGGGEQPGWRAAGGLLAQHDASLVVFLPWIARQGAGHTGVTTCAHLCLSLTWVEIPCWGSVGHSQAKRGYECQGKIHDSSHDCKPLSLAGRMRSDSGGDFMGRTWGLYGTG